MRVTGYLNGDKMNFANLRSGWLERLTFIHFLSDCIWLVQSLNSSHSQSDTSKTGLSIVNDICRVEFAWILVQPSRTPRLRLSALRSPIQYNDWNQRCESCRIWFDHEPHMQYPPSPSTLSYNGIIAGPFSLLTLTPNTSNIFKCQVLIASSDLLIILVHLLTLLKLSFRSNTTSSSPRIDCGSSYKFAVLKPLECYKTNDISYYHHGSKESSPPNLCRAR